ncbi:9234_t:CDS:2 [Gigaspora rosea]|nr:9234_t:CDS:2 [Gigaspora rosea]
MNDIKKILGKSGYHSDKVSETNAEMAEEECSNSGPGKSATDTGPGKSATDTGSGKSVTDTGPGLIEKCPDINPFNTARPKPRYSRGSSSQKAPRSSRHSNRK